MLRPALATLALVLAACASKPAPPPVPPVCPTPPKQATLNDIARFKDALGACEDQACRDKVHAAYDDHVLTFKLLFPNEVRDEYSAAGQLAIEELLVIEERACACADAACAERVQGEFETWAMTNSNTKGSQAQADEAGKIAERISECRVRVIGDD